MSFTDDKSGEQPAADQAAIKAAADKAAQPAAPQAAPTAPTDDHNKVFLVAGERAFADAGQVVKHVEHSQSHIATLETEALSSRNTIADQAAEILRLKKIEEVLNGQSQPGTEGHTDLLSNDQLAENAAKAAVSLIENQNVVNAQNSNLVAAEAAAEKAYGPEVYKAKIQEIAKSLNMSLAAVDNLGKTSPDAFGKLFLPANPAASHQPAHGTIQQAITATQQSSTQQPQNIVKLSGAGRRALVAEKMKNAGVPGYT